jgi:succinoglycan biosynthesis transport protein ExoP
MKPTGKGIDGSKAAVEQALRQLRRHASAVVVASLLLSSAGIAVISLLKDTYVATTTILVDPQKIPERYVATTVTSDPGSRLNALTQLVLSATKLQEIMDRANLYPEQRKKQSREELLDYVRSKIKIDVKSGSEAGLSSFTISYEDSDRFIVAPMANQLAETFIDWNLKVREQQALGTSEFLTGEVQQAKKSLEDQEEQLKAFRVAHSGETPDELSGNLQALSALQVQLQSSLDATSRLDEERILLTQTTRPAEVHDTSTLSERGRLLEEKGHLENQLWQLRQQFTDTYPDVIAVMAQLKTVDARLAALPAPVAGSADALDANSRVRLALINKDLQRQKDQQARIQHQMGAYQGKVQAVPGLEMQLADLTRNYEASKQNYQTLLDKSFSAGMAQDLENRQEAERFTALDKAQTPEKPIKPKRLPLMAVAVLLSILLSAGVTIGLGMISGSVQSEQELREVLPEKATIIGTIPPILSELDRRKRKLTIASTAAFSILTCIALSLFLMKVRPIL